MFPPDRWFLFASTHAVDYSLICARLCHLWFAPELLWFVFLFAWCWSWWGCFIDILGVFVFSLTISLSLGPYTSSEFFFSKKIKKKLGSHIGGIRIDKKKIRSGSRVRAQGVPIPFTPSGIKVWLTACCFLGRSRYRLDSFLASWLTMD